MEITKYFASDLFKGKTVFVTGGGSGINLGVAKNFAAVGANIAICGRTQERLDGAAKELEARAPTCSPGLRTCASSRPCKRPSTRRSRRWVPSTCWCVARRATSCAAPRT